MTGHEGLTHQPFTPEGSERRQPSQIALAMAKRDALEAKREIEFMSDLDIEVSIPTYTDTDLNNDALTIDAILRINLGAQSTGRMERYITNANMKDPRLPESANQVIADSTKSIAEGTFDRIRRTAASAKEIAEETGADISNVLLNEEKYVKVMSRAFTPNELATLRVNAGEAMPVEETKNFLAEQVRSRVESSIRANQSGISEDALGDIVNWNMQSMEDYLQAKAERDSKQTRDYQYALAAYTVKRFWGEEGFQELSQDLKDKIEIYKDIE